MIEPPDIIYLQQVDDEEFMWTWCSDRIDDSDVEYIRKNIHEGMKWSFKTLLRQELHKRFDELEDKFVEKIEEIFRGVV